MLRVIDTETTSFEGGVVEIASVNIVNGIICNPMSDLVHPAEPIGFAAMAIHHITEDMVADAPLISDVIGKYLGADACVAHNAAFDKGKLPQITAPWIYTLKLARKLYPEFESHGNQYLRYRLGLKPEVPKGLYAHRALYDCYVTAELLMSTELVPKACATGGGAYEGVITSAAYMFGNNGSQTFGMGLIRTILWAAQVRQAQAQRTDGSEWQCPALVSKKVGLMLQKVLYTQNGGSDGCTFEVRHVFQPGSRKAYAKHADNKSGEILLNSNNKYRNSTMTSRSEWAQTELALLELLPNERVAEMTGRSLKDIQQRRLAENLRRNNWPEFDPERTND